MASTMRASGSSQNHPHGNFHQGHLHHLQSLWSAVRPAFQMALGFGLALALALVMLIAARPARAESIPQVPLLLEPMLKLQDLKLVRRDDRLGIGNLIVKHPPRKKAKPDEPNFESWGSAFLIGECHIMTARHVIDPDDPDNETNELPLKSRIEFVIGPIRDQTKVRKVNDISELSKILDSTVATPVAWGEYQFPKIDDPAGKRKAMWENLYNDWALLKLEKCLGEGPKGYRPFAVNGISTKDVTTALAPLEARGVSGPPESGLSHLVEDTSCQIYGQVEWSLWDTSCYGRPGSSGSPIFQSDGNGGWRVVAILTRAPGEQSLRDQLLGNVRPKDWPWRMQFSQQGVPASRFIDVIRPILAQSGDKAVRLEGVGHDEVFAEKDPAWVEALAKLHEANPTDINATIKWVLAKYRVEGGYAALEAVNKLIAEKPDARELRATRVSIILYDSPLGRTKAWKDSVEDVKQFRSQFPEMAELQWMQAWMLMEGEQCQNAANLFRRLFDRYGIDPSIRLDWANAMACAGEHRAALAAYDELLYYMPKAVPVRYARAMVRFRLGQSEPARVDLRRILSDDEEETTASVLRAAFAMNEGHHLEEAEKDLRAALKTTNDDPSAAFALGAGLLAQGRDAEAVEALLIARKYKKEDLFSALLLNVALTKAGKIEEAKAALKDVVNENDDPSNWQMLLLKHFQGEMSADDFLKAAEAGPEDTKWTRLGLSHAYVGLLAYAKGEKKDARRYFLTAPYLDRSWFEFSVIDAWQRAAEG